MNCWGYNNIGQVMLFVDFLRAHVNCVGSYVVFLCSLATKQNMIIPFSSYLLCLLVWAAELGRLLQARYIPV